MTEPQRPPAIPGWMAMVHLLLFLGSSLFVTIFVTVVVAVVLWFVGLQDLLGDPDALTEWLGAGGNGAAALALHISLSALAVIGALTLPIHQPAAVHAPASAAEARIKVEATFAVTGGRLVYLVPAFFGALTVGLFAGWITGWLQDVLPSLGNLELITRLLTEGTGLGWLILLVAIGVSAPILEEVIFRGFLWSVLERAFHPVVALIGTSLLFMLYHQDPVHVVGLAPTAFFLGWLRWVSGSIWPSILAHFINNALGIGLTLLVVDDTASDLSLPMALLAFAFTCGVSAVTWAIVRFRAPES